MADGFQQLKLGLKITANKLINDVAKDIQEDMNRSHRELDLKINRVGVTNNRTKLEITGTASIDKDKIKTINNKIETILDNL